MLAGRDCDGRMPRDDRRGQPAAAARCAAMPVEPAAGLADAPGRPLSAGISGAAAQAGGFLELCYTPELAVEVTPAADPALSASMRRSCSRTSWWCRTRWAPTVRFVEGEGPKLDAAARRGGSRAARACERLHAHLAPVYETVRRLRRALPAEIALIGFAGAPWTLAAYMVEGERQQGVPGAATLARQQPELFARLIDLLTEAVIEYLRAQIEAGAEVLQLFDSWAGVLPRAGVAALVHRAHARDRGASCERAHPEVPVIAFPRGIGAGYRELRRATVPVAGLGLDTAVPVAWAARSLRAARPVPAGQSRSDRAARRRARACSAEARADRLRPTATGRSSSISATVCCRRHRPEAVAPAR